MMSPLILSLPDMNRRWALALPWTRLPKSSSERDRVTVCAGAASQYRVSLSVSNAYAGVRGGSARRLAAYARAAPTTTTTTQRGRREKGLKRTGRLGAGAGGDLARLLEVDVPALGLAGLVLEGEGEDGVALLDGVLAVLGAGVEGRGDGVESDGGGELVCCARVLSAFPFSSFRWAPLRLRGGRGNPPLLPGAEGEQTDAPPEGGTGWWIDRLRTVGETHGCGVGVCGGGGGGEKDGQRLWNERWGKERDQREAFSSGGVGEISIV